MPRITIKDKEVEIELLRGKINSLKMNFDRSMKLNKKVIYLNKKILYEWKFSYYFMILLSVLCLLFGIFIGVSS